MKKKIYRFFIHLLFFPGFVTSTNTALLQSPYLNIELDRQENDLTYPPCEPSIAIDHENVGMIVAGAILDKAYLSLDTGKTWQPDSKIFGRSITSSHGVYGDPCIIEGRKNTFYYFHLSKPWSMNPHDDSFLDRIVCQRLYKKRYRNIPMIYEWTNGGSIGHNPPKDQDKEWAVVSRDKRTVYCTWTQFDMYESTLPGDSSNIMFSSANWKGKKWKVAKRINQFAGNCLDNDGTVEGAVPAAGPDGEIYVAWALNGNIYFDRSLDKGKTWLNEDIIATEIVGGWDQQVPGIYRCNGMPVTVCNHSEGPDRGKIYICWSDQLYGADNTDIWIISSADKGNTWSNPVMINNDNSGTHQFFPWLSIDQTNGNLYVVFYDRRNYTGMQTDVYLASSSDGGLTWLNERISESPFVPDPAVFFGDYNNISAHDGVIAPVWTRCDDSLLSIWTTIIRR